MKTILIFVSSLDGKVTRWGEPNVSRWSSHEDQEYFKKIRGVSRLIVMGSNTYMVEQTKPSPNHHVVVLTHYPETYNHAMVPGQLEFCDETPAEVIKRFEKEGSEQMLVIGGPHVASSFLKAQLIDELWLTLEPRIFGTGDSFVTAEQLDISLRLLSFEKVNESGTLITKYEVVKNYPN